MEINTMNKTIARRAIKALSLNDMKGNWFRSFVAVILAVFATTFIFGFLPLRTPLPEEMAKAANDVEMFSLFIPKTITAKTVASLVVTLLLYVFVTCPLMLGISRFYLKAAHGEKGTFGDIFSPFASLKTVFGSIWINVIILAVSFLWGVPLIFLPSFFLGLGGALNSAIVLLASGLLLAVCAVFYILWVSRYNFALLIYAEGNSSPWKAFRASQKLLRGRSGEILSLRASYFGWEIAVSVFPPLSFVYYALCNTVYAKYLYYLRGELSFGVQTPSRDV